MMKMEEEIVQIVAPYSVGREPTRTSLVVIIPKEVRVRLDIKPREKFFVKIDKAGRIIYERLKGGDGRN